MLPSSGAGQREGFDEALLRPGVSQGAVLRQRSPVRAIDLNRLWRAASG